MPLTLAIFGAAGITALTLLAKREAQRAASTRHSILDAGLNVFDTGELSIEQSGYPKIEGTIKGAPTELRSFPIRLRSGDYRSFGST